MIPNYLSATYCLIFWSPTILITHLSTHPTSVLLSFILASLGVILFWKGTGTFEGIVLAALITIVSGFLAPVSRDLVAALQSLRK